MISVLMVLPRYLPLIGGAEVQCSRLIQEINGRAGDEVKVVGVITRRVYSELKCSDMIDSTKVHRLPPTGLGIVSEYAFCFFLFFHLVFNFRKYDVIHCHASSIFGITCSLAGAVVKKKVLVKVSTNGEVQSMQKSFLRRKLCSFSSKFCIYVALNKQGFEEVGENIVDAKRTIIPNGIDFEFDHSENRVKAISVRKRLEVEFGENLYICIFVGRLVRRKGINDLLIALSRLDPDKKIVILIVGNSDFQRDGESLEIKEGSRVVFYGLKENIFPYLFASDLFISPSYGEGLPNTVIEALSCGKTCILSDIPPHLELYEAHPSFIRLFATGDIASLSKRITESFHAHSFEHNKLLQRECNVLINNYAIKEVANEYLRLYKGER